MKSGIRDLGDFWIENDGFKKVKRLTRLENDLGKKMQNRESENPISRRKFVMIVSEYLNDRVG